MSENVQNDVFANISQNQRRAIDVLLAGGNKDKAAVAAGVTVRTVDRWLAEPAVRAALDKGIGTAVSEVARRMVGAMDTAVTTMLAILEDEKSPATVKLRAAISIIEHGPNLLGTHDLVQRITKLEALLVEQWRLKSSLMEEN